MSLSSCIVAGKSMLNLELRLQIKILLRAGVTFFFSKGFLYLRVYLHKNLEIFILTCKYIISLMLFFINKVIYLQCLWNRWKASYNQVRYYNAIDILPHGATTYYRHTKTSNSRFTSYFSNRKQYITLKDS